MAGSAVPTPARNLLRCSVGSILATPFAVTEADPSPRLSARKIETVNCSVPDGNFSEGTISSSNQDFTWMKTVTFSSNSDSGYFVPAPGDGAMAQSKEGGLQSGESEYDAAMGQVRNSSGELAMYRPVKGKPARSWQPRPQTRFGPAGARKRPKMANAQKKVSAQAHRTVTL